MERMIFDQEIAPILKSMACSGSSQTGFGAGALDYLNDEESKRVWDTAANAQRFDCKSLDESFLWETGSERLAAMKAKTEENIHLPFEDSVFEFASHVVIAKQYCEYDVLDDWTDADVEKCEFDLAKAITEVRQCCIADTLTNVRSLTHATYIDPTKDYIEIPDVDEQLNIHLNYCTRLLAGVCTLFDERLLIRETKSGETHKVNRKRLTKGKPAILPYCVVRLNLAETRRRTQGVRLDEHESPRLHWRRGHWRTLGRLSEFERRTWVRRCLVGDSTKGFVAKHYAVTWQPTIH